MKFCTKSLSSFYFKSFSCIIFLTACLLFIACTSTPSKSNPKNQTNKSAEKELSAQEISELANLDTSILVSFIRKADYSDEICTKKIEYPEFYHHEELNKAVIDFINSNEAEFDSLLAENLAAMSETGAPTDFKGTFNVDWKKGQMNGQFVSIIIDIYYFVGGANGIRSLQSFNYDIKNDCFIKLETLFDTPRTLEEISALTRKELEASYNSSYDRNINAMIKTGTEPAAENFSVFTFDDYNITFWFQKYQVLPGAAGTPSVTIARQLYQ